MSALWTLSARETKLSFVEIQFLNWYRLDGLEVRRPPQQQEVAQQIPAL